MSDKQEHLDEGTIHAWLDEALPPDESGRVEAHVRACVDCAALVAEARGLMAASSRILSSLDAVPGGVLPGRDAGVDQLAALRARRNAAVRPWWRDRRIVVAASLLVVAGTTSVVWRSVNGPSGITMEVARPAPDNVSAVAAAPGGATLAESREASARDAKAESPPPLRAPSPVRVAAADSAPEKKVPAASSSLARQADVVANEARLPDSAAFGARRLAVDSTSVLPRAEQDAKLIRPLQQGAPAQQQAFRQLRSDSARPPAAPSQALAERARFEAVRTGVGAARAAITGPGPGSCYRLRLASASNEWSGIVPEAVYLLAERMSEPGDLLWFRAQVIGASRPDTIVGLWRAVDSITVELRARTASASPPVRFLTTGALVDTRTVPGVLAALAVRTACP